MGETVRLIIEAGMFETACEVESLHAEIYGSVLEMLQPPSYSSVAATMPFTNLSSFFTLYNCDSSPDSD